MTGGTALTAGNPSAADAAQSGYQPPPTVLPVILAAPGREQPTYPLSQWNPERVVVVSQAAKGQPRTRPHLPRITLLNTDGQRHPLENTLTAVTLAAGIAAFAVGWVVSQHLLASWLGAVALAVGLYAQLISATRQERMLIVTGLVAAFVGLALGLAHGGFHP